MRDVGTLRIRASVADGNVYRTISSKRIRFETFPVCAHTHNICNTTKRLISDSLLQIPVIDCGRSLACFKQCRTAPQCDPDESELLVTMGTDDRGNSEEDIIFKLGGKLFSNGSDYIAIGIGSDYYMRNMDIVACSRDRKFFLAVQLCLPI